MRRVLLTCGALLGACWVASFPSIRETIDIDVSYPPDSVVVGERFRVRYSVSHPDSLQADRPSEFAAGTCRILEVRWREEQRNGERVELATVTALALDLDRAYLPPQSFLFTAPSGDTLTVRSEAVEIPVRHVALGDSLRPLKPQWEAPRSYARLFVIAALVALALAGLYFLRRLRKREAPAPVEPALPPDYIALKELDRIDAMRLPEKGEFKRHYTLVVDVLRHYLEDRFGVEAMDRTTFEILADIESRRLEVEGLEALLGEADLVKFAKHLPDAPSGERALESARDIVARTAPRPVLEAAATTIKQGEKDGA